MASVIFLTLLFCSVLVQESDEIFHFISSECEEDALQRTTLEISSGDCLHDITTVENGTEQPTNLNVELYALARDSVIICSAGINITWGMPQTASIDPSMKLILMFEGYNAHEDKTITECVHFNSTDWETLKGKTLDFPCTFPVSGGWDVDISVLAEPITEQQLDDVMVKSVKTFDHYMMETGMGCEVPADSAEPTEVSSEETTDATEPDSARGLSSQFVLLLTSVFTVALLH